MAAAVRRRANHTAASFEIHQDAPGTEDTEMMVDSDHRAEDGEDRKGVDDGEEEEEQEEAEEGDEAQSSSTLGSSDDEEVQDSSVQFDMETLTLSFRGFSDKYRLIKRIGEGTFSTVYKAEDLLYDQYQNDWDADEKMRNEMAAWNPPPLKKTNRRNRYVAVKKIYVTSSPIRILNELDLLHDLRNCPSVCPLITAFRSTDQVVAVLPYFRHQDFRTYFRDMTIRDMAVYLRCLFTALAAVHDHRILHRDIKPTNFLYEPSTKTGVLVDFGLAEREGIDSKPCLCHEAKEVRRQRIQSSAAAQNNIPTGYPKNDTRPSRRANRAGTRGFRAPEVLFKCTEQTSKIDIWSAGVILLTILSKRFPFFNSADDVEAMIEIATIFGSRRMRLAGLLHGCMMDTSIPTIGTAGFSLEKIILWSTCRTGNDKDGEAGKPLDAEEKVAVAFLERCLDLDPAKRISAREALQHDFLKMAESNLGSDDTIPEDDDIDLVT